MTAITQPISYSAPLRKIRDHTQKYALTGVYFHVLAQHHVFEDKWRQADEATGNNPLSAETIQLYLEAIAAFDFYVIRNFINDIPNDLCTFFLNEQHNNEFFARGHQGVLTTFNHFAPDPSKIQWIRNSIQSFTRPFLNDLAEMEKAWRYIETAVSQSRDTASNLRGGMTGGSIGGVVGSFLLPGLGTLVGAAVGGYLLQQSRHGNYHETIARNIVLYSEHIRHFIALLHSNARELYMILGKAFDLTVTERLRNTYQAIKAGSGEADLFMFDYLNFQELVAEEELTLRFHENFTNSTAEAMGYVEWFLKNKRL